MQRNCKHPVLHTKTRQVVPHSSRTHTHVVGERNRFSSGYLKLINHARTSPPTRSSSPRRRVVIIAARHGAMRGLAKEFCASRACPRERRSCAHPYRILIHIYMRVMYTRAYCLSKNKLFGTPLKRTLPRPVHTYCTSCTSHVQVQEVDGVFLGGWLVASLLLSLSGIKDDVCARATRTYVRVCV